MIQDTPANRSLLETALHVSRWVSEVASGCPYDVGLATCSASPTSPRGRCRPSEIEEALASHPRIGVAGLRVRSASLSRSEQAASATDDPALVAAMAAGNAAYEERFGRIFLIRAAGRSRPEILAELNRRLALSPPTRNVRSRTSCGRSRSCGCRHCSRRRVRGADPHVTPPLPSVADLVEESSMSQLTTHVLDIALGRPAAGVPVVLSYRVRRRVDARRVGHHRRRRPGAGRSAPESVPVGTYRFVFDTAAYFAATGQASFLPEVVVVFDVIDSSHYHVPVLLSPFAYSTYRGS